MANSAALCRSQEELHRRIAAESDLQNVRRIALAAARAWEVQALEAEGREARSKVALSHEDEAIALEFLQEDEADAAETDPKLEDGDASPRSAGPPLSMSKETPYDTA
ncbi:MAG: hypothetical protein ABW164_11360 [Sphingobium sp.]